jgi:preflagellin peptidase FlaK
MALGTVPDLLRLLAVPVLGYAAWLDVRTRRVPNVVWLPLAGLGAVLLGAGLLDRAPLTGLGDRWFLVRAGLSVGFVVPLAYVFWRLGGFGGADAKALMALALLLPTYPTYYLPGVALPVERTTLGVLSMTVLSNAVLVGLAYPLVLGLRNVAAGDRSPLAPVTRRVPVEDLPERHGRLFESREGPTRSGLDLDALRMYLRWRGLDLAAVRARPDQYRDPASLGRTYEPGDGAVDTPPPTPRTDARESVAEPTPAPDDDWAAAAFLDAIEGSAYGTDPATLREGLETVVERDRVRVSPGVPFLVPVFVGLVCALTYGDLLFGLLAALGLV